MCTAPGTRRPKWYSARRTERQILARRADTRARRSRSVTSSKPARSRASRRDVGRKVVDVHEVVGERRLDTPAEARAPGLFEQLRWPARHLDGDPPAIGDEHAARSTSRATGSGMCSRTSVSVTASKLFAELPGSRSALNRWIGVPVPAAACVAVRSLISCSFCAPSRLRSRVAHETAGVGSRCRAACEGVDRTCWAELIRSRRKIRSR